MTLSVCLILPTTGCITSESRAKSWKAELSKGMSQFEVRRTLGPPIRSFPVPGQGDDDRLPVQIWRYTWTYTTEGIILAVVLFPFGLMLSQPTEYGFDVGFDRKGDVNHISEVLQYRGGEPEERR